MMPSSSSSSKPQPPRRVVRRLLQFASPAKEQQYRAEMAHVQRYICAQVGGLDEESASLLLGVHDSRSRSQYEEIQEFLERKHQLEQQQQQQQPKPAERVLIRSLDEYLNELDPSLFVECAAPVTPKRLVVANLPAHSSYIRRKQEEARLARLWSPEHCSVPAIPCGGPLKRQRVM